MRKRNKKKRRHSFGWLLVLAAVLAVCGFVILRQERQIYQMDKEMEATAKRVEQLKQDQAELKAEKERLDDLKYIEKLAREEHNMVGKDEVPLFIVDEKEAAGQNK